MTKYYCKKCDWVGRFPNVLKIDTVEGPDDLKRTKYIIMCPDCPDGKSPAYELK